MITEASPASDWPTHTRAAGAQRGVYVGQCAICTAVRLTGSRETTELQQTLGHYTVHTTTTTTTTVGAPWTQHSSRTESTQLFSSWGKEESQSLVENAVRVPAPHQPAVRLRQPARWPADGGLFVRPVASAGRLLQLRDRWVIGGRDEPRLPPRSYGGWEPPAQRSAVLSEQQRSDLPQSDHFSYDNWHVYIIVIVSNRHASVAVSDTDVQIHLDVK